MKTSVLIDSCGWVDYFSGGPLAGKYAPYVEDATPATHFTPSIVLYEVHKRIKSILGEEQALTVVARMISNTAIVDLDRELALDAAEISIKFGLAMADSIVKATAEKFGATVVTGDKHFKGLEGVILVG